MERILLILFVLATLLMSPRLCFSQTSATTVHPLQPNYPRKELERGISGTTLIKVRIDSNGKPLETSIFKSSGNTALDNSAMEAVKISKFNPGKDSQGTPIASDIILNITFQSPIDPPEKQLAYLKEYLSAPCGQYYKSLIEKSQKNGSPPEDSYDFRWPLLLFEELFETTGKIARPDSLMRRSTSIYPKFESSCKRNPEASTFSAFSKALGYRP